MVESQTGVSRQRSHSGPNETMNKGVLAHIRPDRPHERISIPECLSAAPSTGIANGTEDRPSTVASGSSDCIVWRSAYGAELPRYYVASATTTRVSAAPA